MKIRITCRHCDLDPELDSYIRDKVSHLAHYFDRVDEANVVLEAEGHRRIADLTVHASRAVISSQQEADDLRSSFDRALDKVERQIRRYKEKVRSHKAPPTAEAAMEIGGTSFSEVGIVPESLASKSMTPEQAFEELDGLEAAFLVFLNSNTQRVNVIYRRDDGDYGLVEPAGTPEE